MRCFRKDDDGFGRTLGVFLYHLAQLGLHMRLECLSDVDLLATDLVTHGASSA